MTESSTQAELPSTGKMWGLPSLRGVVRRLDLRPWEAASYAALLLIGLSMRLWDLGSRAMHHDESLHALYSWNLFTGDGYQHNPMMHGPFQFEANAAMFFVFGDSDVTARLLYAVMGAVLIVMPLLLRWKLGRLGALFSAALLTASPTILYFSRFARNDILMAVWTLGLVICMWRYFDEGRRRYLYVAAALLALAFSTKESSYLVVATLGLWSFLLAVQPYVSRALESVEIQGVSPPVAVGRVLNALLDQLPGEGFDLRALSRPAAFMVFLITITLPQWSAFAAIFQDSALFGWTNLVLAAPVGSFNIGAPVGGANAIAFLIVVGTLGASIYFGFRWNWSVWWKSALIFYTIWTLLYSTFLTNFYGGIKSGIWQALGYWVVQQGEGRGGQPWYYYFVVTSVYEFLPFFVGVVAAIYFLVRKRDRFSAFLVFWPLTTFLLYTVASEKMPWLLVNIALPFILLAAKLLADVIERIEWRRLFDNGGYLLIPGVPLFMILLWNLAMYTAPESDAWGVLLPVVTAVVLDRDGRSGGLPVPTGRTPQSAERLAAGDDGAASGSDGPCRRNSVLPEWRHADRADRLHPDVSGRNPCAGQGRRGRCIPEGCGHRRYIRLLMALGLVSQGPARYRLRPAQRGFVQRDSERRGDHRPLGQPRCRGKQSQ